MAELLVNVDVDDLERGVAFFASAFGLRRGRRLGPQAAELLGASAPIYLLEKPAGSAPYAGAPERRRYGRHWTPVHLDFVVEDVDAAVRRAEAAGARVEGEIESHAWGRIAYGSDPFGHGFCLLQFLGRGYDEIAG
jgi:lactoylglutathione lyase